MQFLPATFAAHARPVPPAALTRPARTIRSTPSTPPPATSAPPAPAAAPTCPPRSTPTTTPASASPTSWPRPPPTPAPTAPARTLPAATPGQEHRPRPPAPRSITPGHSWARPIAAVASAVPAYPLEASRARRAGSFDSGPPASFATPTSASEAPSITPSAPGPACSVEVRKLGSTDVAISCPASEKKLAAPTPTTPDVSHRSSKAAGPGSTWSAVSSPATRSPPRLSGRRTPHATTPDPAGGSRDRWPPRRHDGTAVQGEPHRCTQLRTLPAPLREQTGTTPTAALAARPAGAPGR